MVSMRVASMGIRGVHRRVLEDQGSWQDWRCSLLPPKPLDPLQPSPPNTTKLPLTDPGDYFTGIQWSQEPH